MKLAVKGQTENLLSNTEKFKLRWEQSKPRDTDIQDATQEKLDKSLSLIKEKAEELKTLEEEMEKLKKDHDQLGLPEPDLTPFRELENDIKKSLEMWSIYEEFHNELGQLRNEDWIVFRSKMYRLDDLLKNWESKLENEGVNSPLGNRILQEIQSHKDVLPILKFARGDAFSDRHWVEMLSLLDIPQKSVESLTVGDFLAVKEKIVASQEQLQELNGRAASEIAVRQALSELDAWEVTARFTLAAHNDAGGAELSVIKEFGEVSIVQAQGDLFSLRKVATCSACLLESHFPPKDYVKCKVYNRRLHFLHKHKFAVVLFCSISNGLLTSSLVCVIKDSLHRFANFTMVGGCAVVFW